MDKIVEIFKKGDVHLNLDKLFETQKVLDARIEKEHPRLDGENRLAKKLLSLQVELGELANEWRGFKFWSNNQEPRKFKRENCPSCSKKGYVRGNPPVDEVKGIHRLGNHWYDCPDCHGFLVIDKNPLLEEYVDCLHFILSIGLEHKFQTVDFENLHKGNIKVYTERDTLTQFGHLFLTISEFAMNEDIISYEELFLFFIALGSHLGFTWEQIEEAYYQKNEVNHERQNKGY